jgi:hypothetical protein
MVSFTSGAKEANKAENGLPCEERNFAVFRFALPQVDCKAAAPLRNPNQRKT